MLRTVTWLSQQLGTANAPVVFDCRFHLQDPAAARNDYLAGHIPGAWFLDMEHDLAGSKTDKSGRHPLPELAEFAAKLSAAGVTDGREIVVYDNNTGGAVRAWWLIRHLGHEAVSVLDGGWTAWVSFGGSVSQEIPEPMKGTNGFVPRIQTDWVVSTESVEAISAGRLPGILMDARAPERYRGDVEPIDPKAGHIPGAINLPWMDNLNADGTWKPAQVLRERFAAVTERAEPIVSYCGSGVTACGNLFAMALAGLPIAKLYPGSWSE